MQSALFVKTVKTARLIFFGIFLQATLFSFWGMQFFITSPATTSIPIAVYVVFPLMAFISFLYGIRFFQNYTKVKKNYLGTLEESKLKEVLLLIYAIHLLLLEFVAIVGILVAIFTQKQVLIYPFYFSFLLGFWFSYPQEKLFAPFFNKNSSQASL